MKRAILIISTAILLISCKRTSLDTDKNTSIDKTIVKEVSKPKQVVVVQKISITGGKYQKFLVSGRNFEFTTRELTFGVRDTIIIQGDKVYPKSDSTLVIDKLWY